MRPRMPSCTVLAFLALSGCSGSQSPAQATTGGGAALGGARASGGANTGGHSSTTTGGNSTGGTFTAVSSGTGGNTANNTMVSPTGGMGTGGTVALGGTNASTGGGTKAVGGTTSNFTTSKSTGGSTASGGTSSNATTGGAQSGTGGTKAAGGNTSTATTTAGGAAAAGGTTGTGGTSATAGSSSTEVQHWVGTWTASPYVDTNQNNTPPFALSNTVIRQVTHVSLGGKQIRVQFSNLWGNGSLVINGAHVALCKASPKVDGTIDAATDKALSFSGSPNVTIAAGKEIWSDPIDFVVANQGNVTITTLLGSVPSTLSQHSGSRTNSYFKAGGTASDLSATSIAGTTSKALWFFISGIDVMANASARGIVAMGDSITDGRGTDTDMNNRWTDILAARLQANSATANVSMMNQAIGATNLAGSDKKTAQSRFDRDVLGMSGVKYVIVLDGVNDIGSSGSPASTLKTAYADLISRAHDKGLLIYGGTILPFGGYTDYDSEAHEGVRTEVNLYIRSGVFDGFIDFDAALRDPVKPTKLLDDYAKWDQTDWLHPSPEGYKKMGQTPELTLFTN